MAAKMSCLEGWIQPEFVERITQLLSKANLPTTLANIHAENELGVKEYQEKVKRLNTAKFLDYMFMDKK